METKKQDTTTSTPEPRRAVKLNAETLRALEGEDASLNMKKYGLSTALCTPSCPW
ncbi:MAG TPA: hypothetical protein VF765_33140 [Polyangiaceae bacterium]